MLKIIPMQWRAEDNWNYFDQWYE